MDINEYIRKNAFIFNNFLIDAIKKLLPSRTTYNEVGIVIKPIVLERPKVRTMGGSVIPQPSLLGSQKINLPISGNFEDMHQALINFRKNA